MDAVLADLPAEGARTRVTCRLGGDAFILVEYGPIAFDLSLNLYAHMVARALEEERLPGVTDLAPGIRSLLVGFDPLVTTPQRLADQLIDLHADIAPEGTATTGRGVTLPLAFDDATTREAVSRHQSTLGTVVVDSITDIEAIAVASGMDTADDVLAAVVQQRWYVAFVGYYPGLPFLLPMNDVPRLQVPKLDRLRAWTADGAVSLGGACVAIFPVAAPGSYRVFGRTVPIYAQAPVNDAFDGDQMLLRAGDVVTFESVCEEELTEARRNAYENRYVYEIAKQPVVVDLPSGVAS